MECGKNFILTEMWRLSFNLKRVIEKGLKKAFDETGKIKSKEWCVKNFCTDITDQ